MKNRYLLLLLFLGACGGSGGGPIQPPPPPPVVNEKPGGIWFGARANGTEIVVLISEDGNIRVIDEFGNQGFGTATVSNGTEMSATYKLVPQFARTLIDGSDFADCTFEGTVQERVTMTVTASCLTSFGTALGGSDIVLTYDESYEMDSSIARVAGTYMNPDGDIMTIDVNGALFLQNVQFGCVVNGEISLLDTDWNLYSVNLVMESCMAEAEPFNGASWSGFVSVAVIDGFEFVAGGLVADVDGQDTSLIVTWQRI